MGFGEERTIKWGKRCLKEEEEDSRESSRSRDGRRGHFLKRVFL